MKSKKADALIPINKTKNGDFARDWSSSFFWFHFQEIWLKLADTPKSKSDLKKPAKTSEESQIIDHTTKSLNMFAVLVTSYMDAPKSFFSQLTLIFSKISLLQAFLLNFSITFSFQSFDIVFSKKKFNFRFQLKYSLKTFQLKH